MYIESKPAQIHLQQANTATNSFTSRLRRSPAASEQPSSSSLRFMERTVPSFQAFVNKALPVSLEKPLPPVPRPSVPILSRTSSIYSQTTNDRAPSSDSCSVTDSESTCLYLPPSTYSLSTPELSSNGGQMTIPSLLHPRVYEPLLRSPCPSSSSSFVDYRFSSSTASPLEEQPEERRTSMLLPPTKISASVLPNHCRAVSLSRNIAVPTRDTKRLLRQDLQLTATVKAPTLAFHHKSRSLESLGVTAIPVKTPPFYHSPLDQLYHESWQASHNDTFPAGHFGQPLPIGAQVHIVKFGDRDSKLSDPYFAINTLDRDAMAPVVERTSRMPSATDFKGNFLRDNNHENEDKDSDYSTTDPNISWQRNEGQVTSVDKITNANLIDEADRLAKEYRDLLPSQPMHSKRAMNTMLSDGRHVRLAPHPLFFNPRQVSKQRAEAYARHRDCSTLISDTTQRIDAKVDSASRWRNDSPTSALLPLQLSLTPHPDIPRDTKSGKSTSSLVDRMNGTRSAQTPMVGPTAIVASADLIKQHKCDSPFRGHHVNHLEDPNNVSGDGETAAVDFSYTQPAGATIVATRAEAEAAFNIVLTSRDDSQRLGHEDRSYDSSVGGNQRTIKNPLTHVGERMANLTSSFHRVPDESSHVSKPSLRYWSDSRSRHDSKLTKLTISAPITHFDGISIPHGKEMSNRQHSTATQKRPSIFTHVVDRRRESKANKRREELKRSIKLVPYIAGEEESDQQGWGGAHLWI